MIDTYDRLTLGKFLKLREINVLGDELDIQAEIIAVLSDSTVDDVLSLPLAEYGRRASALSFLAEPPRPGNGIPRRIVLNGRKWRVLKDVRDMSAGQYIDFQTYLGKGDTEKWLREILSTLILPEGKEYADGYDIQEAVDAMNDLPVLDALRISAFFLSRCRRSIDNTLTCLAWRTRRMAKKMTPEERKRMTTAAEEIVRLRDSLRNGDGSAPWTPSASV